MLKKFIFASLITTLLGISSICSAAWVYVGDYIVDPDFENMVGSVEYVYSTIAHIKPKPENHSSFYYRLYYDDNGDLNKFYTLETGSIISLVFETCLVPMYGFGESAKNNFPEIRNKVLVKNGGCFSVYILSHTVMDCPPKVPTMKPRIELNFKPDPNDLTSIAGAGPLYRYSVIENICQRFDNEIRGIPR